MIVTARPPRKRPKRAAQPAEIAIATPRIVKHLPPLRRGPKPLEPDPEADARVDAFFKRMGIIVTRDDA